MLWTFTCIGILCKKDIFHAKFISQKPSSNHVEFTSRLTLNHSWRVLLDFHESRKQWCNLVYKSNVMSIKNHYLAQSFIEIYEKDK